MQFTGYHFPSDIILQAIRYYVVYKLSYRDIEEIFTERGIRVDHATINRRVIRFAPLIEQNARAKKRQVSSSWRMDETYIKIKGKWWCYYRAIDKYGDIVDFYISQTRDEKATKAFLRKAIRTNGLPDKVIIDKRGANAQALHNMNIQLWNSVVFLLNLIEVIDVKYLNNIVEQSHRPIKQKMRQALGWKSIEGAQATISGQEVWTQVRRGQVGDLSLPVWERFYALAA
ncbi:IS6 family transposase (plasmid) [Photobacterium damselae subsp. damselae]|uniref:Transposase and inactivated derivatives-like protein n=1 Tax=Photobacterium damselae subsp. damselae TaxID=85581 RepID=E4WLC3_PHODD|nr:IS6 family transposase [Photobacterium damselae]QSH59601.1 IS6 family transposase [Photobacterium damselae subsp. damselae]CBX86841.1 Transposase and inactivated derivatives-like protein [Photobacterium damselae subsp. damselae]